MSTVKQALAIGRQQLAQVETPALEAEILLAHLLKKDRSWLFAWSEKTLQAQQLQDYSALLKQRITGMPIAYITGYREFWTLDLQVSPDTLIPRPETELLVSLALEKGGDNARILDLGTGSGAIALAIASEQASWNITATDQSSAALAIATKNALKHNLNNVHFIQGSWFQPLNTQEKFDLIVSNPPYVAATDAHLQQGDLPFEPAAALSSGEDGLDDLRLIIDAAKKHLVSAGWLMVEHGFDQGSAVQKSFQQAQFNEIITYQDLQQQDRVTVGKK